MTRLMSFSALLSYPLDLDDISGCFRFSFPYEPLDMDQKPGWTGRKPLRSVCEASIVFPKKFPFQIIGPEGSPLRLVQVQCTIDSCRETFISRKAFEDHLRDKKGIHRFNRRNSDPTSTVCLFKHGSFECKAKLKDGNSVRHLMTHFPIMRQCLYCDKTFARKHYLEKHVQEKHQNLRTSVSSWSDNANIIVIDSESDY